MITIVVQDFDSQEGLIAQEALDHFTNDIRVSKIPALADIKPYKLYVRETKKEGEKTLITDYVRTKKSLSSTQLIDIIQRILAGTFQPGDNPNEGGQTGDNGILFGGLGIIDFNLHPYLWGAVTAVSTYQYVKTKNYAWLGAAGYSGLAFLKSKIKQHVV